MIPDLPHDAASQPPERPPYRPPVGLPARDARTWRGTALSVALHVLVVLLIITPFFAADAILRPNQGAGGAGPAGGGGGGRGGTGGDNVTERLQYVQVAPTPAPVTPPAVKPPVTPPVVRPVVPPVVPPVAPPKPTAQPTPSPTPAPLAPAASVTPGSAGGSGADGSAGNGPGSGGGVGSGEGTGRGSANGPGTGGGPGTIYPPTPSVTLLPPQAPRAVKGTTIVANFDVDERGNVLSVWFNETRDSGYNRKLRDMLRELRFRPATRLDGTPVRDTAQVAYTIF